MKTIWLTMLIFAIALIIACVCSGEEIIEENNPKLYITSDYAYTFSCYPYLEIYFDKEREVFVFRNHILATSYYEKELKGYLKNNYELIKEISK